MATREDAICVLSTPIEAWNKVWKAIKANGLTVQAKGLTNDKVLNTRRKESPSDGKEHKRDCIGYYTTNFNRTTKTL